MTVQMIQYQIREVSRLRFQQFEILFCTTSGYHHLFDPLNATSESPCPCSPSVVVELLLSSRYISRRLTRIYTLLAE